MFNPNHSGRDEKPEGRRYHLWGSDSEGFGDSMEAAEELAQRDKEIFGDDSFMDSECCEHKDGVIYERVRPRSDH